MNHKNFFKNMANNSRSLLMVVLLIVLVVLAYRYQREGFEDQSIHRLVTPVKGDKGDPGNSAYNVLMGMEPDNLPFEVDGEDTPSTILDKIINLIKNKVESEMTPAEVDSGVPPGTVIIYHLDTKDNKKFCDDYLGSKSEGKAEILVGGFDEDGELIEDYDGDPIPYGFQLCNGAELQKIKVNDDGSKELKRTRVNTPDYRGRFLIGASGHKGTWQSDHKTTFDNDADDVYTKDANVPLKQRAWFFGRAYYLGQKGGSDMHTLLAAQMPLHGHSITDKEHSHRIDDKSHDHSIPDKPHTHTITDKEHHHSYQLTYEKDGGTDLRSPVHTPGWDEKYTYPNTGGQKTGITGTNGSNTGITRTNGKNTGITGTRAHGTGITGTNAAGENKAHNNMPPFTPVLYLIKI